MGEKAAGSSKIIRFKWEKKQQARELVPIRNQIQRDLKDFQKFTKKEPYCISTGRCFPYVVQVKLKYIEAGMYSNVKLYILV